MVKYQAIHKVDQEVKEDGKERAQRKKKKEKGGSVCERGEQRQRPCTRSASKKTVLLLRMRT
jgi:hypothetical protein